MLCKKKTFYAVDRKIEEVQVENELDAFYKKLGCDMIEIIHIGGEYLMVVDEEGRLRNREVSFRLPKSEGSAGNALVVRDNGGGDFTDSNSPMKHFEIAVVSTWAAPSFGLTGREITEFPISREWIPFFPGRQDPGQLFSAAHPPPATTIYFQ